MPRTLIAVLLGVGLMIGAAACSDSGQPDPGENVVRQRVALKAFDSCAELEQHIEDLAVREMKAMFDGSGGVFAAEGRGMLDNVAAPTAGAGQDGASAAPTAYTQTNTQVAGVDEPDFVKNDGTRILVLVGQMLYAAKSWPPADLSLAGQLQIEGWPQQMLFDAAADRVVVFSSVDGGYAGLPQPMIGLPMVGAMPEMDCVGCGYYGFSATKITIVDVSDLAQPKAVEEFVLPGSYSSARSVGSSVRVVLSDNVRWPEGMRFWPEYRDELYDNALLMAVELEELKKANEALIRARTLEQWLPPVRRKLADGTVAELGYQCSDFSRSDAPVHLGLTTVATLDLKAPEALHRTSIVEQPAEIYASTEALYLTSRHWWWTEEVGQTEHTYLHKFDITDPTRAIYIGSGAVEGHIINQFALDEHEGNLRVATTINRRVEDAEEPWRTESVNRVSVLAEGQEGGLEVIGRTPDLAPGERIQSARFIGDRGFVVTFRQIDPLFTLDLSTPAAPKVVGELKIPGFSTYIHPLDRDHLLAIGIDLPAEGWGEQRLKLTIFDVTDFAQPREKYTQIVGSAQAWSEATHEHKAFNYFAERKLLAIPFTDYSSAYSGDTYWSSFVSEVRVFDIDVASGISPRGAISLQPLYQTTGRYDWAWYYSPWVRRSVMASDQGQDFVYAIGDGGIAVADADTLGTTIASFAFPVIEPDQSAVPGYPVLR